MILLPFEKLEYDEKIVNKIKNITESTLRLITYSREHLADDLLTAYISKISSYKELLSVKNAQMEAHSKKEAKEYAQRLKIALDYITDEIKNSVNIKSEVQLFRLFRLISPGSHLIHPNKYRNELVQIGKYLCPEPQQVPNLVSDLFYQMEQINNPIIRAIYFHHELIRIHPFSDGNGRTTRMAKNWMLMYELYSPIFISKSTEKINYIRTLESSFIELENNPGEWNHFLEQFFEQELSRLLKNSTSVFKFVTESGKKRI